MTIGIFEISVVELCLAGTLLAAFIYEVYFYCRYLIIRQKTPIISEQKPPVTVIVCARNEGYNLRQYVQSLLTQDYPEYEVIIVNDSSEDNTQEVIDDYMLADSRVRTTFVPRGARVGSTKKLGLTLAAKAAKYDYLLLTDADCRPESKHWMSAIMAGFKQPETEIVLGFGAYFREPTMLNSIIQYETLFNGLHYLGAAATGKPYMGVGRNLAYRKHTFFEHGGFSDQMTSLAGDDDLFVNKVANNANTFAVYSKESITWSVPKKSWKEWWLQKRRHLSVSPSYKASSKHHLVHEPIMRGLFYVLVIALMVMGEPLTMCLAFCLLVIRLLLQVSILDVGARKLGQPSIGLEVMWYDIFTPLVTLAAMVGKKRNKW